MRLTIRERFTLLQALPRTGNLATIKIVRELREVLSFDEREHALLGFYESAAPNGELVVNWRSGFDDGDKPPEGFTLEEAREGLQEILDGADVAIGIKAAEIVQSTLERLNEEGALREEHISLCEKFEVTDKET